MENKHPGIIFFSGGTALNGLAAYLADINPACSYIITTFDSGGSSADLRDLFDMPAVGDVRNRLIALADIKSPDKENIVRLLSTRLPRIADKIFLHRELSHLASGSHPLMSGFSDVVRNILADRFSLFIDLAGDSYNPANACLGNIILAAGFMSHQRVLAPPIAQFSRLIGARGIVRASTIDNGHLAVRLQNGEILAGQHLFTGKEFDPVPAPIDGMWICSGVNDPWPRAVHASSLAMMLIKEADMIVYPMGSFYSSLLAALSPHGLGQTISLNPAPKIFVPNMGYDPELIGHDLALQVERLLEVLRLDNGYAIKPESVLNAILIDSENGNYQEDINMEELGKLPIKVIDRRLVSEDSDGLIDPELLGQELMDLALRNEL
ncbi:GAK system CofD-like protein [Maridesulfovibrio zosterae]|uniref:GAK system CofD-like protein n=1 Tax=Maridesulfovibrio zosterae TaxID=82171 RepID=UPI0004286D55|nr:GAK system CofD-like protein [Maridesulfovibrio zosterae]